MKITTKNSSIKEVIFKFRQINRNHFPWSEKTSRLILYFDHLKSTLFQMHKNKFIFSIKQ